MMFEDFERLVKRSPNSLAHCHLRRGIREEYHLDFNPAVDKWVIRSNGLTIWFDSVEPADEVHHFSIAYLYLDGVYVGMFNLAKLEVVV